MSTPSIFSLSQPLPYRRRSLSTTYQPNYSASQSTRGESTSSAVFFEDEQEEELADQLTPPRSGDEHEKDVNTSTQKLVFSNIDGAKEDIKHISLLAGAPVVLGRRGTGQESSFTDGFIACPVMSKTHAQVVLNENGKITIVDAGSMHGTFVNDRRLKTIAPVEIQDGDRITFGKDVEKRGSVSLFLFPLSLN
ncbi:SMAD/FHA domain-containing protein [Mrakia frigida]|uniref:FHA domain-containing protein n=1 Tax=Mrakia frigida TaxID=29902 RepID=UPI003FCBF100